jgi:hypothetical protein
MFNNTIKNEYTITYKNLNHTTIKQPDNKQLYIDKINKCLKKQHNHLLKIYTNKHTIKTILEELSHIYKNNHIITFSNNKYSINIYSYDNCYYIIDCFHMNTITLQNYKKLIYEIYTLIINERQAKRYLNVESDSLNVLIDNINKLDNNKVKVIQHIFCNKIFNLKKDFNYIELHYYIKKTENTYFKKHNEMFLNYNEVYKEDVPSDNVDECINHMIVLYTTNIDELYKYIQTEFCNKKYSIDLILQMYKFIINKIVSAATDTSRQIELLDNINAIFEEFNYYKVDSMKHLIYENFIIKTIKLYNEISNLT